MNPTFDDLAALKRSLEHRITIFEAKDGKDGKDGPKGPQGPQGPQGPKGAEGAKGAQGPKGAEGAKGAQGPKGTEGAKGADGAPGISITEVKVDIDGHLTVHLSDGAVLDAGNVASEDAIVTKVISGGGGGEGGTGGTGGGHIIQDSGTPLAQQPNLNFTGTGVSTTNVGDTTTVTITAGSGGGSGNVVGPASATDNAIARYDNTTGKRIQDSSATIDDSGNLSVTGTVDGRDVAADGTTLDAHVALTNEHIDWTVDQGATNIHSGNYTDTDTTYVSSDFTHDSLTGVDADEHIDWSLTNAKDIHPDNYTDTNTTYVSSDFVHDDLTGFVANEHIDWTLDQGATNIHAGNYTDTDTVVEVLDEGVSKTSAATSIDFTGTGVTASNVGTDVTVTIDAGLSDLVDDTTPELGGTLDCLNERIEGFNTLQTDALTGTITSPPVSGSSYGRVVMNTNQTHDYSNGVLFGGVVIPAGVLAKDTFTIKQDASLFGLGSLFLAAPTIQNESATAADLASYYTLSGTPTYKADTQDISIQSGPRSINVKPTLTVTNSGTLAANYCSNYWTQFAIDDGVTTTAVVHTNVGTGEGTAAASSQGPEVGFQMYEVAEKAMFDDTAVVNAGVAATSLSGKWMIHQGDNYQYPNRWNGGQYYKLVKRSGAQTLDETDHVVVHTGTSARTFTLPNITTANKGQEYVIIRDATATTTIDPDASDTINGGSAGAAITITTRYDSVRLISDGVSKWYSI